MIKYLPPDLLPTVGITSTKGGILALIITVHVKINDHGEPQPNRYARVDLSRTSRIDGRKPSSFPEHLQARRRAHRSEVPWLELLNYSPLC